MTPNFDLKRLFYERIVVHCQTKEQVRELLKKIAELRDKDFYKYSFMFSLWDSYGTQTCYSFYDGMLGFSSMNYYISRGYDVIEASDIIYDSKHKSKFMKKYNKGSQYDTQV